MGIISRKNLTYFSIIFIIFLILQRTAGIFTKLILANSISPYEYGLITLVVISIPSMFQYITNFNFYEILSHSGEGKHYLGFAILFSIIMFLFISVLLLIFKDEFFSYLNIPLNNEWLFYVAITVSLFLVSIIVDFEGFFAGHKIYALPGILMAITSLIRLLVVFILFFTDFFTFEIIILLFAFSNIFPLIYILISKQYKKPLKYVKNIKIPSPKIMAFGISVFLVGSYSVIGQSIIKLVISHNLGIVWQGYYDVSLTVASILIFGLMTMKYLSIPEATSNDLQEISKEGGLGDVSRALFSLLTMIYIIIFFYSNFIVEFLFSENYIVASEYIYIIATGYLFLFIQNFVATVNLSRAYEKREYYKYILIPCLMFPFFYFLTDFLISYLRTLGYGNGFLGAYLSYTVLIIAYAILTLLSCKDKKSLELLFFKSDKLLFSAISVFILLLVFKPSPVYGIIIGSILFIILIFVSGYLKKDQFLGIIKM